MTTDSRVIERRALLFSAAGALFMAVLGIGFSLLTHSEAIMLDGLFSLLAFVMALAAIRVSRLVYEPGNVSFQFGYAGFEPLFNVVKGLVIVFLSLLALYSAVMTILDGGSRTEIGWALVYAIVAALGCFIVSGILAHVARKSGSPLLRVDAKNWMVDGVITAAVLLGFLLVYLAEGTRWEWTIPYADPMVVMLLVLLSLPVPYLIIRNGLKELLLGAPDTTFQKQLRKQLGPVLADSGYKACGMRVAKTGRMLYANVFVLLHEEQADTPVVEQDKIRDALTRAACELYPDTEVDLFLTRDEKWARLNRDFNPEPENQPVAG